MDELNRSHGCRPWAGAGAKCRQNRQKERDGQNDSIYEDGVLRPVEPVDLREGERVQVTIEESAPEIRRRLAAVEAFESEFEDLSEKQWKEFEQAVQRRPLFGKVFFNHAGH